MSAPRLTLIAAVVVSSLPLGPPPSRADSGEVQIDTRQIVRHVVPRDAIPALITPKYDSIADAGYMRPDDRVIALDFLGSELAYPTRILDHHEIVDDLVNGQPVLVTY